MISVNKVKKASERGKGFIILLYGPPGTGKTSIARSIAHSLRRPSRFISFSGVSDSHFIKGHRRTYVDSQPGVFVKEL
jgi:Lon-like ATP-dependent protease